MTRLLRILPALPVVLFALAAVADEPPTAAPPAAPPAAAAPALVTPPAAPPSAAPASAAPADPAAALRASLPHDLSPWSMFLQADSIVKAVMIGLAIASIVTWTAGFAKAVELHGVRGRLRRALAALDASETLRAAQEHSEIEGPSAELIRVSIAEIDRDPGASVEGIKERIASRLERIEATAGRMMSRGTGVLATIGATAPFVGLFGTVWGIMNSFIGISKAQTTNLAVVAPGIAEALLATAMGLVAAIPAVVIYNMFARQTAGCRTMLADESAAVLRLVSRELDRNPGAPKLRIAAE